MFYIVLSHSVHIRNITLWGLSLSLSPIIVSVCVYESGRLPIMFQPVGPFGLQLGICNFLHVFTHLGSWVWDDWLNICSIAEQVLTSSISCWDPYVYGFALTFYLIWDPPEILLQKLLDHVGWHSGLDPLSIIYTYECDRQDRHMVDSKNNIIQRKKHPFNKQTIIYQPNRSTGSCVCHPTP